MKKFYKEDVFTVPVAVLFMVSLFVFYIWIIPWRDLAQKTKAAPALTQECVDVTQLEDQNNQLNFSIDMCQEMLRDVQSDLRRCEVIHSKCRENLTRCAEGPAPEPFDEPYD